MAAATPFSNLSIMALAHNPGFLRLFRRWAWGQGWKKGGLESLKKCSAPEVSFFVKENLSIFSPLLEICWPLVSIFQSLEEKADPEKP